MNLWQRNQGKKNKINKSDVKISLMPKPRDPYTQPQACNFPFNHNTSFHIHFSNPSKIKLFAMFKKAKKKEKERKDIRGKERGNSATTSGGDAGEKHCQPQWCRCKQKLDWA